MVTELHPIRLLGMVTLHNLKLDDDRKNPNQFIIIIIIIVLRYFSALQYGLDGFPYMPLSHITRFRAIGDVAYRPTGVEADVLWPDALPDANPTYS